MKQNTALRLGQWFYYILLAISVIVVVIFYINSRNANPDDSELQQMNDIGPIFNIYIFWAYTLIALAVFFTLVFPIVRMVLNPKSGLKTLIALVLMAIILFVAYTLGDDTIMTIPGYTGEDNVAETLKLTDMGIFTMYIFLGGALIAMVFSSVRRLFR